ncbi:MAG: cysteine desulfurase family protein [Isosphaeraceae bacterium]
MIYLDHNATSPLDPEVLEAMRPFFLEAGNAESRHSAGRRARRAWEESKGARRPGPGCRSGRGDLHLRGHRANNLALFGLAGIEAGAGHIVSSPIEHPAVAEPVARLEAEGFAVDRPPVGREGVADAEEMAARFTERTRLVTLMLANNEVGSLSRSSSSPASRFPGASRYTDAVQAVGRIPVHFHALGVTTLAASGHKFHGPVGAGILLVRRGVRLKSWLLGGTQQQGRRPGTVPVPLVVGLAAALDRWQAESSARTARWRSLRDRLESGLVLALGADRVVRNGPADPERSLPQTINLGFPGIDGEALLMQLDLVGVAVSLGAACASGSMRASPTLVAMRVPDDRLRSSVRFSLGATTTEEEIEEAIRRIVGAVHQLLGDPTG